MALICEQGFKPDSTNRYCIPENNVIAGLKPLKNLAEKLNGE